MKLSALTRVLVIAVLAVASTSVLADRGHRHGGPRVSFGLHFGLPLFYHPWNYYPAPAYYYPAAPIVVQPAAPPVYVERSDVVPEGAGSWYFCRESNGYYPYVKQCPGGWTRVPAQPANQ